MPGKTQVKKTGDLSLKFMSPCPMIYQKLTLSALYLSLLLLAFTPASAVEIKTSLDRNPVNMNESFQIIFSATESPDDDPDFSPLEKNFEILNQSHQSNSSWINGKSSKSIQWILNVMAKRTGDLLIPPVAFGDDLSRPASIKVTDKILSQQSSNENIFLDVNVSSNTPYVQSQLVYTIHLYHRVALARGSSLSEPNMANAVIEKLVDDKNYETEINGVTYAVIERKYAIFPQKSGSATIEPLVLTAQVLTSSSRQRFSGFFNQQITKTRRVTSKAITLDVQPAPANFKAKYWIPAELVHIEEKWSGDISNMKLGEPLTRTLTILAKGTTVAQLPELETVTPSNNLKTYPDQAILKEKKQEDGIIAFREQKIAYIPSKPGNYTLAAIEIPWFNTQTQEMEIARIPEVTLTAKGSVVIEQRKTNIQENIKESSSNVPLEQNTFWMWLSLFLMLAWLATILFFLKKQNPKPQESQVSSQEISLKKVIKDLKQACNDNDPLAAKNALLAWGKIKFNSHNMADIAAHCEARLRDEINALNQTLYAKQASAWQGKKLFQFFSENKAREKVARHEPDELEPLYKE